MLIVLLVKKYETCYWAFSACLNPPLRCHNGIFLHFSPKNTADKPFGLPDRSLRLKYRWFCSSERSRCLPECSFCSLECPLCLSGRPLSTSERPLCVKF